MSTIWVKTSRELEAALKKYASQTVTTQADATLFTEGEPSHGCYLVVSGTLRLFIRSPKKKASSYEAVAEQGCLLGLPATINGQRYSLTCKAESVAELAYLSRADVRRLIAEDSTSAMMLLDLLSTEVHAARKQIASTTYSIHVVKRAVN